MLLCNNIGNAIQYDDWIITKNCTKESNKLCNGYYYQPFYKKQITPNKHPPLKIISDEANLLANSYIFIGNVKATKGNKIIFTDKAIINHNYDNSGLESIVLNGNVKIMQPGWRIDGMSAAIYINSKLTTVRNAVYRIYDQHIRGTSILVKVFNNKDMMFLKEATYTTCAPYSNEWHLQANKIRLNKITKRGEAWHGVLYIKDVPVFYYPYINYPIDKHRKSGFLQPNFENSSNSGATFVFPYYWNIAPNFDALIKTKYMYKRGWKFDTHLRYLTNMCNGEIKINFIPYDKKHKEISSHRSRYSLIIRNNTYLNKKLNFKLDYAITSDTNYLNDFMEDELAEINALQQGIINYADYFGNISLKLQKYKTLHINNKENTNNSYKKLILMPEISFESHTFNLPYNFYTKTNFTYVHLKTKNIDNYNLNFRKQINIRPELTYHYIEPGWFIKSSIQLNYVHYSNIMIDDPTYHQRSKSNIIPIYNIDSGIIFERKNNNGIIQTLEPRLYYLYVPKVNQNDLPLFDSDIFDYNQIFKINRYSGWDKVVGTNQLDIGVSSKFYNNGDEIAIFEIGQIYYINNIILHFDNEVNYNYKHWSPFTARGRLSITPKYNITTNYVHFAKYPDTLSFRFQYNPDKYKIFNIGYEKIISFYQDHLIKDHNNHINQINISGAWKINPPIYLLGKFNYDIYSKRNIQTVVGLEYSTCCTALRFLWSRELQSLNHTSKEYKHKFNLQFILKGFTGIGNTNESSLSEIIPGYETNPNFK